MTTHKINLMPLMGLMIVLAVLAITTAPSLHALQAHPFQAERVFSRSSNYQPGNNDPDWWQKECQDGRTYTFHKLAGKEGKHVWDVSIDVNDGDVWHNVTKFTCKSDGWIRNKLLWCIAQ